MANVQSEIQEQFNLRMINGYEGIYDIPKQIEIDNTPVIYFDVNRDIIIALYHIGEYDKDNLKYKNIQNMKIMKLNPRTEKFEFTSYKNRIIYKYSDYNCKDGHLFLEVGDKLTVFTLDKNSESIS